MLKLFIFMAMALFSCEKKKSSETGDGAAQVPTSTPTAASSSNALPTNCTSKLDQGLFCITCTPRDIPLSMAVKVKAGFDANRDCQANGAATQEVITCSNTESGTPFVMNLTSNQVERIFNLLPIVMTVSKSMIQDALASKPQEKLLANGIFDYLTNNLQVIVFKREPSVSAKEFLDTLKPLYPTAMSAADEALVLTSATQFFTELRRSLICSTGVSLADVVAKSLRIFEAVPGSIGVVVRKYASLASLIDALSKATPAQSANLSKLLTVMGFSSLEDLLKELALTGK